MDKMYRHFFSYCMEQTDMIFKDDVPVARIIGTIVMIVLAICVLPLVLYSKFKILEERKEKMMKTVGCCEDDI
ncbi:hypothetical protein G5B30_13830 [Sphingobacterium sp. SGG-5]|uniref:hypothetical protein n=1 Tax=Sphingobacterium sp. SGG-5 TaxID=2710881 RepID=UPI0013EB0514|nr:hypothetical protein [Sphingobacterium sp. SGG-5]NGM62987.1 hypothetical protein [Sphingobacterium sp. SGG-5]